MVTDATRAEALASLPTDWPQRLHEAAARYERAGGVLPTGRRGRFDRERLPDTEAYYTEAAGLRFRERRGVWRTTSCAFHGGSDSMRINLRTGGWCCMSCGASGGDVLAYHMRAHGVDFVEAARQLGAWIDDAGGPIIRRDRRAAGLSAADALALLRGDALLLAVEVSRAFRLGTIEEAAKASVLRAAARIMAVVNGGGPSHAR